VLLKIGLYDNLTGAGGEASRCASSRRESSRLIRQSSLDIRPVRQGRCPEASGTTNNVPDRFVEHRYRVIEEVLWAVVDTVILGSRNPLEVGVKHSLAVLRTAEPTMAESIARNGPRRTLDRIIVAGSCSSSPRKLRTLMESAARHAIARLRVEPLDIPQQQQPEVWPRRQARTRHHWRVEGGADALHEGIELRLVEHAVQASVKPTRRTARPVLCRHRPCARWTGRDQASTFRRFHLRRVRLNSSHISVIAGFIRCMAGSADENSALPSTFRSI
jgi:hypothetical protein